MKQRKRRPGTQLICLFLAVWMLLCTTPVTALDLSWSGDAPITSPQDFGEQINISDTEFENELYLDPTTNEAVGMRDAFTKHFLMDGGVYEAVLYPERVHYFANNAWEEVDNTLRYQAKSGRYAAQADRHSVSFADSADDSSLVSIGDGEYTISWSVHFAAPGGSGDVAIASLQSETVQYQSASTASTASVLQKDAPRGFEKAMSSLQYANAYGDRVHLRYSVAYGKVEEDIILSAVPAFNSYRLVFDTDGLTVQKTQDNRLLFLDEEDNAVFTIAAPWMKDAASCVSSNFEVTVTQSGSTATVTYRPDRAWLTAEERVYPVLIDPSVTTRHYQANLADTYVMDCDEIEEEDPHYDENTMLIGRHQYNTCYGYLNILNFPSTLYSLDVTGVTLTLFASRSSGTTWPAINLYEVLEPWDQETIHYFTQPSVSSTTLCSNVTGTSPTTSSVSSYTFVLDSWFENLQYCVDEEGGSYEDYNYGFKLTHATEANFVYSTVIASTHEEVYNRPLIKFTYRYSPYGGLVDNGVYNFVNVQSGKYMTASPSSEAAYGNIFQYTGAWGNANCAFRLHQDADNNCFVISPVNSEMDEDGDEYITALYFESENLNCTNPAEAVNAEIMDFSSSYMYYDTELLWIIEYVTYDKVRIVPAYDANMALTAVGNENGSTSGWGTTSPGNIYLAPYTGADSQLWYVSSGGRAMKSSSTLVHNSTVSFLENSTSRYYNVPVTELSHTVTTVTSTNSYVASVETDGSVRFKKAGLATIDATIVKPTGNETRSMSVVVILPSGVYLLNNYATYYKLGIKDSMLEEGAPVQLFLSTGSILNSQLFKINHIGNGRYSIRSMLDSSMGLVKSQSGTEIVNRTIGYYDSNVSGVNRWIIDCNENGYCIKSNSAGTLAITASTSLVSGSSPTLETYSPTNTYQNWYIRKYSQTNHGIVIKNPPEVVLKGSTHAFDAGLFSTTASQNGQGRITWSVSRNENGQVSATIDANTGVLTGVAEGTVTVTATYSWNGLTASTEVIIGSKRAIILLPGMMGSQISTAATIEVPNDNGNLHTINANSNLWIPNTLHLTHLRGLKCSANGSPIYSTKCYNPTTNNTAFEYGVFNIYRAMYLQLYREFCSNTCDVVMYEYDWRLDPYQSALSLNDFINARRYDEIVFVSHSMGGIVSSYYLSLGPSQRSRVDKHITLGTPFLGSEKMVNVFATGAPLDVEIFDQFVDNTLEPYVREILPNMQGVYSMMPYEQYFNPYLLQPGQVNNFYPTYDATVNALGSGLLPNWNELLWQRTNSAQEYLFWDGAHISTFVDSFYIVGTNIETASIIRIDLDNTTGDVTTEVFNTMQGDGTVTLWSATVAGTLPNNKIHCVTGYKHFNLAFDTDTINLVVSYISGTYGVNSTGGTVENFVCQVSSYQERREYQ